MTTTPPNLDDLRVQARHTYRYWPIYLMLRLREIDQHLTPAQLAELDHLPITADAAQASNAVAASTDLKALLAKYGLLGNGDLLPMPELPFLESLSGADYLFTAGPAWVDNQQNPLWASFAVLAFQLPIPMHLELLRTTSDHLNNLKAAALTFTQIRANVSATTTLQAARLWAALHGARALTWQPVTATQLAALDGLTADVTRAVPPANHLLPPRRRRGKGQFREAHP